MQHPRHWMRWLGWKTLLTGIIFGLFGLLTLWADMRIPIVPDSNIAADTREIFVVLGAWFGGPIGGLLAGGVSALYSPIGDPALHFSTWIAHSLAGLALGLVYLPKHKNLPWLKFVVLWAFCVLVYYLSLVFVVTVAITLLKPEFIIQLAGPNNNLLQGYMLFFSGAYPEMVFVFLLTLFSLLALPKQYRKPVWDVDKPSNP